MERRAVDRERGALRVALDVALPPLPEEGGLWPDLRPDAHPLFSNVQPEDRRGMPRCYLDVDGVLVEFYGKPNALQLRAGAGSFLRFLADNFNIVWCTAWHREANLLLPALLGFPHAGYAFPAIVWSGNKASAILKREGESRFWVWVDDSDGKVERESLKGGSALGNRILVGPSKPLGHVRWKLERWLRGERSED